MTTKRTVYDVLITIREADLHFIREHRKLYVEQERVIKAQLLALQNARDAAEEPKLSKGLNVQPVKETVTTKYPLLDSNTDFLDQFKDDE